MSEIFIAAAIATAASLGVWGGLLYVMSGRQKDAFLLVALALPFSALINIFVKGPIAGVLLSLAGIPLPLSMATPIWFLAVILFLSPLTEEAIKLAPLASRALREQLVPSALYAGLAAGIGFGIGEIWYLAWGISTVPAYSSYPFYYFTGFMGERFLVVLLHGAMTAIAASMLPRGAGKAVQGYILAVCLHAFLNLGAILYQIGAMGVDLATYYIFIPLLIIVAIFERLRRGEAKSRPPKESVLFSRQ
jgi:hypothetical protein